MLISFLSNTYNQLNNIKKLLLMRRYSSEIEKEKKKLRNYLIINTGKTPKEDLGINCLPLLSKYDENSDIALMYMSLILKLDSTNELIIDYCDTWKLITEKNLLPMFYNSYYYRKELGICSYIISDIKYFIDMIISITWYLKNSRNLNIKVSSIGEYINKNKDPSFDDYDQFIPFMKLTNDISNAYKHSVSNIVKNIIGKYEPCILAKYSKHNKDISHPKIILIPLSEYINNFQYFYNYSKSKISKLSIDNSN